MISCVEPNKPHILIDGGDFINNDIVEASLAKV